jgi:predicted metalloprotease with PDZ domain
MKRYIAGHEVPDYARLFASVGFVFRRARSGAAWLGDVTFSAEAGRVVLGSTALVGQPLYAAGLERGDTLLTLDGRPVASSVGIDSILGRHKPGDTVEVSFRSRGIPLSARLVLKENPRMELVPGEAAGVSITPGAMENRRRWLASRAGTQGAPR